MTDSKRLSRWLISAVLVSGYLICSPAISVFLSDLFIRYNGNARPELTAFHRTAWCVVLVVLGSIAIYISRPTSGAIWRLICNPARKGTVAALALLHVIGFQILCWNDLSAFEAIGIPISPEQIAALLFTAYGPALSISQHFIPYQQYNPAPLIANIAFAIGLYSIPLTVIALVVLKVSCGPSQRRGLSEHSASMAPLGGFSLEDTKQMHLQGKLSDEEFQRLSISIVKTQVRPPAFCVKCGCYLRANSDQCPKCGAIPPTPKGLN